MECHCAVKRHTLKCGRPLNATLLLCCCLLVPVVFGSNPLSVSHGEDHTTATEDVPGWQQVVESAEMVNEVLEEHKAEERGNRHIAGTACHTSAQIVFEVLTSGKPPDFGSSPVYQCSYLYFKESTFELYNDRKRWEDAAARWCAQPNYVYLFGTTNPAHFFTVHVYGHSRAMVYQSWRSSGKSSGNVAIPARSYGYSLATWLSQTRAPGALVVKHPEHHAMKPAGSLLVDEKGKMYATAEQLHSYLKHVPRKLAAAVPGSCRDIMAMLGTFVGATEDAKLQAVADLFFAKDRERTVKPMNAGLITLHYSKPAIYIPQAT